MTVTKATPGLDTPWEDLRALSTPVSGITTDLDGAPRNSLRQIFLWNPRLEFLVSLFFVLLCPYLSSGAQTLCSLLTPISTTAFSKILTNSFFFFFKLFIYLFIYLWLCWVFISVRGLFPVAASGGHSSSRCAGLSLSRPLLLRSTGSRHAGSVTVAHGLSCSAACGIFPDQGSNPCPLHWQADSQPLRHQGSP